MKFFFVSIKNICNFVGELRKKAEALKKAANKNNLNK